MKRSSIWRGNQRKRDNNVRRSHEKDRRAGRRREGRCGFDAGWDTECLFRVMLEMGEVLMTTSDEKEKGE